MCWDQIMLKEKDTRNKLHKDTKAKKKDIVSKFYPKVWLVVWSSIEEVEAKAQELYLKKINNEQR